MSGFMKVQVEATERSFELVCSHACVFFSFNDTYSEELKLLPQLVWFCSWNLSQVIWSFINLVVSLLSPYSKERRNKHARAREREVARAGQILPVLEQMGDPNSTVLEEKAAAIAVVPPASTSDNSAGPSLRPGRAMLRCPVDGCFVTRRNEALLNLYVENSHQ